MAYVRETLVLALREGEEKSRVYRGCCPRCGAIIRSVNMPNGGWAHFEGAEGLGKIKHPCFDKRASVKRSDDGNLDLFADYLGARGARSADVAEHGPEP